MNRRTPALIVTMLAGAITLSGCSFTGINSYPLPFSKGGSSDAVHATVLLANAANLVPNSEVKYDEVTIGSVRKIQLDGWTAKLTLGLDRNVHIPAGVTAKVAQKSLLGAEYLELNDPTGPAASSGPVLKNGDVIGLNQTARYPETEEVLTAAAMLFNGGGLPQFKTIATEFNTAFTGRTHNTVSLVHRIDQTAGVLNHQRQSIFNAMEQLRKLSATVNGDTATISRALDTLPQGVNSLDQERAALTSTLESFSRIEAVSRTALAGNGKGLGEILNNLRPVTAALVGAGTKLPRIAELLTYPFPTGDLYKYTRSDYLNLFATFRINAQSLASTFVGLTPLDGLMTGFISGVPTGPAAGRSNPLTSPLDGLTGTVNQLTKPLQGLVGGLLGSGSGTTGPKPNSAPSASPSQSPNLLQQLLGGN